MAGTPLAGPRPTEPIAGAMASEVASMPDGDAPPADPGAVTPGLVAEATTGATLAPVALTLVIAEPVLVPNRPVIAAGESLRVFNRGDATCVFAIAGIAGAGPVDIEPDGSAEFPIPTDQPGGTYPVTCGEVMLGMVWVVTP